MSLAATHFDPVVGVDIHMIQPPGPVPPVPMVHPFVGIVFDPTDYLPFIGSTVKVNGIHRAIAGTAGKAVPAHIPIGGVFVPPLPGNECENFMGSATVSLDGDAAAYMGLPCLSCQSVGMPPPPRMRSSKIRSLLAPTSVVLPVPKGAPVMIGGPPTISLMNIAMSLGMAGLGRALRRLGGTRVVRGAMDAFRDARKALFRNLDPGFLKCRILRAEPVDSVTGELVVDQIDFVLPGRIPLRWTRSYRSGRTRLGHCGLGWETPADARLELQPDGSVLFHDGAGVASWFERLPRDSPISAPTNGAVLSRTEGHLTLRKKGGLTYHFPVRASRRVSHEIEISAITDAHRNSWSFTRDERGLAWIVENTGRRIRVESRDGRLVRLVLEPPDGGPEAPLVAYGYDGTGALVSVRDALGHPYRFDYQDGVMVRHTDRNGLSFHYEYDACAPEGRVLHTWGDGGLYDYRFEYDPEARWTEVTDSLGHKSTVEYDERFQITKEIDPTGGTTNFVYDEAGRTVEVVDPAGRATLYGYDADGNLALLTRPDGTALATEYDDGGRPILQTDANGHAWRLAWDAEGRLRARVSPRGGTWRYAHDPAGDMILMTDPNGGETRLAYDRLGQIKRIEDPVGNVQGLEFDALGKIRLHRDGAGFETRYEHDAKGRLLAVRTPSGATRRYEYDRNDNIVSTTDANGHETRFVRFGLGEIAERHQPDGTVVRYEYDTEERLKAVFNEAGERHRLIRDPLGRVVEEIDYWGNRKRFKYDRAGKVVATKDALDRIVRFEHDSLGRLVKRRFQDGAEECFAYDANGNLTEAVNDTIEVTRAYDEDGNLVRETQGDFALDHEYDLLGNRTLRRSSMGQEVGYAYDAAGRASELSLDGERLARMQYDARGHVSHEDLGSHLTRDHAYDRDGRLLRQALETGEGRLVERHYTRNPVGTVLTRETRHGEEYRRARFAYDAMDRIVESEEEHGLRESFSYSENGSLLRPGASATDALRSFQYHNVICAFDCAGNMRRRATGGSEFECHWDGADRLARLETSDGVTARYFYDALGRRHRKSVNGQETVFFWSADILVGRTVGASHEEIVYAPRSYHALFVRGAEDCYVNSEPNAQPTELVDSSGKLRDLQNETSGAVSLVANLGFAGQYVDEESGLRYNRHRYFDPEISQFVSRDPLGLRAGLNPYRYAPNVLRWIDPLGLTCHEIGDPGDFVGFSASEVDDWIEGAVEQRRLGQLISAPAADIRGSGPKLGSSPDIWFHDNLRVRGVSGAPGGRPVEIRTHSTNARHPESGYTTQINTHVSNPNTQGPTRYMDSSGNWHELDHGDQALMESLHHDAGNP